MTLEICAAIWFSEAYYAAMDAWLAEVPMTWVDCRARRAVETMYGGAA